MLPQLPGHTRVIIRGTRAESIPHEGSRHTVSPKRAVAAWSAIVIAFCCTTPLPAQAPQSRIGPATVVMARTERILIPPGWTAPEIFYPQGRIDYVPVSEIITRALRHHTQSPDPREYPWRNIASPRDRVGIQVDLTAPPVSRETINVIIDGLVKSGVPDDNIIVYAGDERDLFNAGIALNRTGRGVRTMGSESEGFRGGLSRIILDYCTVIINVARLRADRNLGMRGCVLGGLASVSYAERVRLFSEPEQLATAAANPVVRMKTRLHILEAYQPVLHDTGEKYPPVWEYRGVLMSPDPVALDVTGMRLLSAKQMLGEHDLPDDHARPEVALTYLHPASGDSLRLGQSDPDQITVELLGTDRDSLIQVHHIEP